VLRGLAPGPAELVAPHEGEWLAEVVVDGLDDLGYLKEKEGS